ncbi:MAG TPA: HBL/NHE enterotoxin family protein [Pyrinomonadaceae bacterium]|nr:HBL/NHE enterotoxin family protein [Pyrinomonadaceae bacterium]
MNKLSFDVEAAKEQLTQVFRDRISAQGSVYNVLNVDLKDITFSELEEKIENQDELIAAMQTALATAKTHCQSWFNDVQPNLTQIPQAAINYGTLWNNTIPLVLDELKNSDPDRETLQKLFGGLQASIGQQLSTLGGVMSSLKAIESSISADANNFSDNYSPFQQLESLDKDDLAAARTTLAQINTMIAQYDQDIEVDTIKAQKDLSMASNAMKYGGKFGDAGKILGLTIGLIFIVSASMDINALLSAVNARLQKAQEEGEYELEMTSLTVQLVSLETASSALTSLVDELDDVINSLQETIDGWNSDSTALGDIISDLQGTDPVSTILSQFDLGMTQAEWDDLSAFSTKWQSMEVSPAASNDIVLNPPTSQENVQKLSTNS